jgi:hypothetical protein
MIAALPDIVTTSLQQVIYGGSSVIAEISRFRVGWTVPLKEVTMDKAT